jgi:hypothetical protein
MKTLSISRTVIASVMFAASLSAAQASPFDFFFSVNKSNATGIATRLLSRSEDNSAKLSFVASPVYGERCVTKIGWCPIPPQPVGAPCMCGEVEGTTLQ